MNYAEFVIDFKNENSSRQAILPIWLRAASLLPWAIFAFKACSKCKIKKSIFEFYVYNATSDGHRPSCKDCDRLCRNPENRREYEKQYRLDHPEKRSRILAKYYKNNKEKHLKTQTAYRQTKSFKKNHRKHGINRRARMHNAYVEDVDYNEIYVESKGICFYCGKKISYKKTEFDHYIPIAKGGLHKKDNIRCSCMFCNRSKGTHIPKEVSYQVV